MTRFERIKQIIDQHLHPFALHIEDESAKHHVPKGAETHFKLIIAAEKFDGLQQIARHRLINNLLTEEFTTGLHALSLKLLSPEEWQDQGGKLPELISPACRNGYHQG